MLTAWEQERPRSCAKQLQVIANWFAYHRWVGLLSDVERNLAQLNSSRTHLFAMLLLAPPHVSSSSTTLAKFAQSRVFS